MILTDSQDVNSFIEKKINETFACINYVSIFAPAFERKHTFST